MDSLSSVALMSMVAKDIDPWCLMFSFFFETCFLRYHKNHKTQSLNRPCFGLTIAGFMEFGQHLLQSNMAMGCHGKSQPEAVDPCMSFLNDMAGIPPDHPEKPTMDHSSNGK